MDPINGDDAQALANNPSATGPKRPLMPHSTSNTPIHGFLQQIPYSFKTVTAAINWIKTFGIHQQPWPYPNSNRKIRKAVIHCLPGLYGPALYPGEIDPRSGLPWNNETFPLVLPNNVSIQGTSSLDTIFDARKEAGYRTGIITAHNGQTANEEYDRDFIDGITLRGAASDPEHLPPSGAAIYISSTSEENLLVVTNCFLVENEVGIAIGAGTPEEPSPISPRIFNNTFAENGIGIWSGYLVGGSIFTHKGIATPLLLNNVFDTKNGASAFEGISIDSLAVQLTTGSNPWHIFEAWDGPKGGTTPSWGRANYLTGGYGFWPATTILGSQQVPPVPNATLGTAIDIQPYTNAGSSQPHGILFIRDLLDAGIPATSYSPNDFRLSPWISMSQSQPTRRNVLVNTGYNGGSPTGPLQWANGQTMPALGLSTGVAQGSNQPDVEFAEFHGWDFDCEGFGNPRIFDPSVPGHTAWLPGANGSLIDMGADEMGQLIMAGYIPFTRIFSRLVPNAASISDHTRIFFVQEPATNPVVLYDRPVYTGFLGSSYPNASPPLNNNWYSQAQANPNTFPAGTNYTGGVNDSTVRYRLTHPQSGDPIVPLGGFMRNLLCDFSPHLILDAHPEWANWFDGEFNFYKPNQKLGVYGSSSWFDSPDEPKDLSSNPKYVSPDNWNLYYNPYATTGTNDRPNSAILFGHLNPPGTWDPVANGGFPFGSFLWPGAPVLPFTTPPFFNAGLYETDAWGLGDQQNVQGTSYRVSDHAPDTNWDGFRYNCEVQFSANSQWSNLQTFLVSNQGSEQAANQASGNRKKAFFKKLSSTKIPLESLDSVVKKSLDARKKK